MTLALVAGLRALKVRGEGAAVASDEVHAAPAEPHSERAATELAAVPEVEHEDAMPEPEPPAREEIIESAGPNEEPPLLVAGRVLMHDRPVRNAYVGVAPRHGRPIVDGTTDRDGRFELRGRSDQAVLVLTVFQYGARESSARKVFATGTSDLVVRLEAPGTVEGWLAVDEAVPSGALTVELHLLDDFGGATPDQISVQPSAPGWGFEWRRVRAGPVRLSVTVVGEYHPACVVDWIDVPAGATTSDLALRPLDTRGFVRVFNLRVTDENGTPVKAGRVSVLGDSPRSIEIRDGVASVVTSAHELDLDVLVSGRRPVHLARVDGDRDVRLERAMPVALQLPLGELPPAPHALKGVLVPVGAEPHDLFDAFHQSAPFDASGRARFLVAGPGAYELHLWLGVRAGDKTHYSRVDEEPLPIELTDASTEATLALRLDERALARIDELLRE